MAPPKKKKRDTFHKPLSRKITVVDGVKFHSKHEAQVWGELLLLQRAGHISKLQRQVKFPLSVYNRHICDYIADFTYLDLKTPNKDSVVVDAKGILTPVYKIKRALMLAIYGITIQER